MTLEWSDEGVEGRSASCGGCGHFVSAKSQSTRCGKQRAEPARFDQETKDRYRGPSLLKQANYDYERSSSIRLPQKNFAHEEVVNALEGVGRGRRERREESLSILLRLLSPITPHIATICGASSKLAACSMLRGLSPTRRHC